MNREGQRSSLVGVRFLPEEKQKLQEVAKQEKMTLSGWVRSTVLNELEKVNRPLVPEVNREIYFELGRISEQIQTIETSSFALQDLQKLLNEVRRELLGLEFLTDDDRG